MKKIERNPRFHEFTYISSFHGCSNGALNGKYTLNSKNVHMTIKWCCITDVFDVCSVHVLWCTARRQNPNDFFLCWINKFNKLANIINQTNTFFQFFNWATASRILIQKTHSSEFNWAYSIINKITWMHWVLISFIKKIFWWNVHIFVSVQTIEIDTLSILFCIYISSQCEMALCPLNQCWYF